jgi:2-polyprenyl-3-methyl-5-hydroxy-6-metoxy-1,4-benzoquinol methylase
VVDVQAPYRWNLRRLRPGRTLDVGCGLGRNLAHLASDPSASGVGVDHNGACVAECRSRGFEAFTPEEFERSPCAAECGFDTLLFAHVLEHLDEEAGVALVRRYLPYVRQGGKVVVIVPQSAGQRTDPTHVRLIDRAALARLASHAGLRVVSVRSFPFPRPVGRVFRYNEDVSVLRVSTR